MTDYVNPEVKEGWTGLGRRDGEILPLSLDDDALHIDVGKKNQFEWWYFDAHLEGGYTLVAFFYAAIPNPGLDQGKIAVELTLLRPDGRKTQKVIKYKKPDFYASTERPEVKIGENYMKAEFPDDGLPVYEIYLEDEDLTFHLTYKAQVKGWKPGTGYSHFADMGHFAWVVPFPRASVTGTVRDGDKTMEVSGVGYHDHNWLNFSFQSIIEYWMWGRVYSENFTVSYAYIQCNEKVDNHVVKVLMAAKGEDVFLSSGEYEFLQEDFEFNAKAGHSYPNQISIKVPNELDVTLTLDKLFEAENMLDNFGTVLRFVAKNIMRIKPGYFRVHSNFKMKVTHDGTTYDEDGSTLHEIVTFKQLGESE
ncbi:MAG: lipocalin-like domain-containing protein [Candidatus Thorarchaeota archaeon]|jgi:predicted secreted hydrolase